MKTALVTGSSDGIGKETARQLLGLGYRVLVHGRNPERAGQAMRELAPGKGGKAEAVWGDLSSMREVVELGRQVAGKAPVLDVLLHNAGVFAARREVTVDGLEKTMAVNHFAVHLLTRRLLGAVQAAPQGRVVVVASGVHSGGHLDLTDLTFKRNWSGYGTYAASKLANVLFTLSLARRLQGGKATANCLHPGVINTKLLRQGFGSMGAPVEAGAHTSVYVATDPGLSGTSGQYFSDSRQSRASAAGRDEALAEALWETSERILEPFLKEP